MCAGPSARSTTQTCSEHALPELHFDYLETRDESETQAIQVMRDTKTGMMFAHHVPKKGMSNVHGARGKNVEKLGYDKIILRQRWQESESSRGCR